MNRIVIIGCGGAGKSTLARQLGQKLQLPVVHLDCLFWKPGWVERDREEFDALLARELAKDQWILDGNFSRTMAQRLARCDTVIYLDYSRLTCLLGVVKRVVTNYGKVRPDMGAGCPERLDLDFFKWVWQYNGKNRQRNYGFLNQADHAKTYAFKNRRQLKKFLSSLEHT